MTSRLTSVTANIDARYFAVAARTNSGRATNRIGIATTINTLGPSFDSSDTLVLVCVPFEATQRLHAVGGADALTSRAIVAEADANLASLTYYFGSKEELVTESRIGSAGELLAPVVALLRSDTDPAAKMLEAVAVLNQILTEHRDDLAAYVGALAASPNNLAITATLQALHRDIAHLLAEVIDVQQSAGQLPSWISPAAMAQVIIAVVHGTVIASLVDPAHTDEAAIGAQFTQLLLGARI